MSRDDREVATVTNPVTRQGRFVVVARIVHSTRCGDEAVDIPMVATGKSKSGGGAASRFAGVSGKGLVTAVAPTLDQHDHVHHNGRKPRKNNLTL